MKHIVTVWGANFNSEEELSAFVETPYNEDGDTQPSAYLDSIGCSWVDEDFMEIHYFGDEQEQADFLAYLQSEYSPHASFAEQLPANIDERIRPYHAIILLYGNDSPNGAINEELFQIARTEAAAKRDSTAVLLAGIEYES